MKTLNLWLQSEKLFIVGDDILQCEGDECRSQSARVAVWVYHQEDRVSIGGNNQTGPKTGQLTDNVSKDTKDE